MKEQSKCEHYIASGLEHVTINTIRSILDEGCDNTPNDFKAIVHRISGCFIFLDTMLGWLSSEVNGDVS